VRRYGARAAAIFALCCGYSSSKRISIAVLLLRHISQMALAIPNATHHHHAHAHRQDAVIVINYRSRTSANSLHFIAQHHHHSSMPASASNDDAHTQTSTIGRLRDDMGATRRSYWEAWRGRAR
jgi:hypothetical protein